MKLFTLLSLLLSFYCSASEVEYYAYINGDNDLIGSNDKGEIFSHGQMTAEQLIAKAKNEKFGLHIYRDSHKYKNSSGPSVLMSFCGGKLKSQKYLGETNSSDSSFLRKLLDMSCEKNPKKALVLWGHGKPWEKIEQYDYSHPEIPFSYNTFYKEINEKELELIVFDSCSMATLETLSLLEEKAKYVIASQFELPSYGIDYSKLKKKNNAEDIYDLLAEQTHKRNKEYKIFSPIVLYKLEKLKNLREKINSLLSSFYSLPASNQEFILKQSVNNLAMSSVKEVMPINLRKFNHYLYAYTQKSLIEELDGILHRHFGSLTMMVAQREIPKEKSYLFDESLLSELSTKLDSWNTFLKMNREHFKGERNAITKL